MGNSVWLYPFILVLLVILPHGEFVYSMPSSPPYNHSCPHDQSLALLQFNQMFSINSIASDECYFSSQPKTMSWKRDTDCCTWDGVTCDGLTGHVIELDLSCSQLWGYIPSNTTTLFQLSHLNRLNLAYNDFQSSRLSPQFLGQFATTLTHLNLSHSGFSGQISSEISHISKLISLDLSTYEDIQLGSHNFKMLLQNLTQLRQLSLSGINISLTVPLNLSSSLTSLDLSETGLYGKLPSGLFALPSLTTLDLYSNRFTGKIPEIQSKSLLSIDLSDNNLYGPIPQSFSKLVNLTHLNFGENSFSGTIPSWLFALPSLTTLILNSNRLAGKIPEIQSKSLEVIVLSDNNIHGHIPQSFSKLLNLTHLDLSIYGDNFSDTIELDMFSNLSNLVVFDIFCNGLSVITTNTKINVKFPHLQYLSLASCKMKELPLLFKDSPNLQALDLSDNQIQGQLSNWPLSMWADQLGALNLRSNLLQGPLPSSICNFISLNVLDLSSNRFNGTIPKCLGNFSYTLSVLDLRNNRICGTIPTTLGTKGHSLQTLNLNGNQLEGILPRSLANCEQLEVLDLGNNQINDTFPHWLGTLPRLQVLVLRYNRFHGPINNTAMTKLPFPNLKIIDLSNNQFIGLLPSKYFRHFKAMMNVRETGIEWKYIQTENYISYYDEATLAVKGLESDMVRILTIFTAVDLSSNKFEGEIPNFIGNLNSLRVLNLSHNNLAGHVPSTLGNISVLESLDLSSNQLVGEIPQQLTALTFLEYLNLSKNHLVGSIPQGKQFNTFKNDSYAGNSALCGLPLSKECGDDETPQSPVFQQEEESNFTNGFTWKVVLMGYGCGIIFGLVMGLLIFLTGKPKWFTEIFGNGHHKKVKRPMKRGHMLHGRRISNLSGK